VTGLQSGLEFLGAARADESLQRELEALGDHVSAHELAAVAERAGYRCTAEELQRAHALDWRMRWARFHAA
jgi:predicted ribosomally synthesized peptide with nif11-like leader